MGTGCIGDPPAVRTLLHNPTFDFLEAAKITAGCDSRPGGPLGRNMEAVRQQHFGECTILFFLRNCGSAYNLN